jgi:hypothetical protein
MPPLDLYLAKADWYAGREIDNKGLSEAVARIDRHHQPDQDMRVDHADWIEEVRPFYEKAKADASDAQRPVLEAHWMKFNQCMTLGATTVDLAQACKYELGALRAQITTKT